jgi:hypothetical protein
MELNFVLLLVWGWAFIEGWDFIDWKCVAVADIAIAVRDEIEIMGFLVEAEILLLVTNVLKIEVCGGLIF